MKVYNVLPGKGLNKCTEKTVSEVMFWIQDLEVGDTLTIRVLEMSESDYNALPEFQGP